MYPHIVLLLLILFHGRIQASTSHVWDFPCSGFDTGIRDNFGETQVRCPACAGDTSLHTSYYTALWGTGPFHGRAFCKAAIWAGIISMEGGGDFTVYSHGALPFNLPGGTQNGVTSEESTLQIYTSFDFTLVNQNRIIVTF